MTGFETYLLLGFEHICAIQAYDHILFIATLIVAFQINDWRRIILILTAFTIGHSITLALSATGVFVTDSNWVEILIASTIFFTAVFNLSSRKTAHGSRARLSVSYSLALCFGFIHGLGFAGQFHALLGSNTLLIKSLLAFNIGVELGQILVASLMLILFSVLTTVMKIPDRTIRIAVSLIAAGVALLLIVQRLQNVW